MEEKKTGILDKIRQKRKEKEEERNKELVNAGMSEETIKAFGRGGKSVAYEMINPDDMGYKIEYTPATFKTVIKENGDKLLHNITILAARRGVTKDKHLASLMQLDYTVLSRYRSGNMAVSTNVVAAAAIGLDVDIRAIFDLSLDYDTNKGQVKKAKVFTEDELRILEMTKRLEKMDDRSLKLVNYVLNYIEGN